MDDRAALQLFRRIARENRVRFEAGDPVNPRCLLALVVLRIHGGARAEEHRRAMAAMYGDWIHRPECRAELEMDADRLARINRIIDIAEEQHNAALLARARAVYGREIARHARAMGELRVRLGVL